MNALLVSSVTFAYEGASGRALDQLSLTVPVGRMHALLGPNGAGKSTLMRIITGQMRRYEGDVRIFGRPMPDAAALLSIGYAPQPISLYPNLTAFEKYSQELCMKNLGGDPFFFQPVDKFHSAYNISQALRTM